MTLAISLDSIVVAVKEQVSCEVEADLVILNMRNGEYFGLNEVGAKIWNLIQESRQVSEIRDSLLAEYPEVDTETCTADLLGILGELADAELVEVASD